MFVRFLYSVGLPLALVLTPTTAVFAQTVLSVQIKPASKLFVRPAREAQAVVVARNSSRISSEVTAVVQEVAIDVGQQVGAGELLAKLDDTDVRLSMSQAVAQRDGLRARLSLARKQLKRLRGGDASRRTQRFRCASGSHQTTTREMHNSCPI